MNKNKFISLSLSLRRREQQMRRQGAGVSKRLLVGAVVAALAAAVLAAPGSTSFGIQPSEVVFAQPSVAFSLACPTHRQTGLIEWICQFGTTGRADDVANAVDTDASGNVYGPAGSAA